MRVYKVLSFGWVLLFFKKSLKNFKKTIDKRGRTVYNIDNERTGK